MTVASEVCHPDCGPIVARDPDGTHAHENIDGRCWHCDETHDSEDDCPICDVEVDA